MKLVRRVRGGRVRAGVELVVLVAVALGLAFAVQAFIVKPYSIPSGSMEPTLIVGQRVLVDRLGNDFGAPGLGSIVVFHPPADAPDEICGAPHPSGSPCDAHGAAESGENYIKRVVGLPGDLIAIRIGHVIRNGKPEHDPYAQPCLEPSQCDFPVPVRVPAGEYFVMGDNRPDSDDSRFWGPIPRSWIIGEAFFTYWPPDRIGPL